MLAFFAIRNRECVAQLDVHAARAARGCPACASRRSRSAATATTCARWSAPRLDASRSASTATARCPTPTTCRSARRSRSPGRGGRVADTTFGTLSARELVVKARELSGDRERPDDPPRGRRRPGAPRGAAGPAPALDRRRRSRTATARRRACGGGWRTSARASAAPTRSQLRTRPVPRAYRVFFRHVGLDPDVERTPVEQAGRRAPGARRAAHRRPRHRRARARR